MNRGTESIFALSLTPQIGQYYHLCNLLRIVLRLPCVQLLDSYCAEKERNSDARRVEEIAMEEF